ncbi:hypothetical protein MHA01_28030 [Marinococcus halophilus]|uniref:Uncharacterized protein n=1 Tax=Marinococcus halophilus TaxID=1371 RepID=A0A510Y938_MARHA|nr:hypothetical protein MHA01_28030 [Marinococcus halophilus]
MSKTYESWDFVQILNTIFLLGMRSLIQMIKYRYNRLVVINKKRDALISNLRSISFFITS